MTFEELKIKKPNQEKILKQIEGFTKDFKFAKSSKEQIQIINKFFKFSDKLESNFTIISIRHSINMNDKKINKLSDICDEVSPVIGEASNNFFKEVYNSKYKAELLKKYGETFFNIIENDIKLSNPKIIPDLIKENQLVNEYSKIIAGAQIEFRGETHNLSSIGKYMSDADRDTRIESAKAYYGYLEKNNDELGRIYDELVKVRTNIAHTLGFKNAIEYCYKRLGRLDYTPEMVKGYRDQIYNEVVLIVTKLKKKQAKRIQIRKPIFLDYNLEYLDGNAKPKGNSAFLVKQASKMYHEMSDITGDFFDAMNNQHLLSLDAMPGKMTGGYMTYIPEIKMPFIFSNSNGTRDDVDTLTHEFGHSLQGYLGGKIKVPFLRSPSYDLCEVHSMSMEFFAWNWMDLFFDDSKKYKYSHLAGAFSFLPYGAEVDEFQHWVYENPNVSHEERCNKWAEIDKKYRPHLNYEGFEFAQKHLWLRQSHIFSSPFYYIDYTIAQVLALQYKNEMEKDFNKAWNKYIKFCKLGGKYSFLTLLQKSHMVNPFKEGTIKKIIKPQIKVLKTFDY
ncbi:MAG: M3 family oligoendopeptidase [Bacillales bacterium]